MGVLGDGKIGNWTRRATEQTMAATRAKLADRQTVLKKITPLLKKHYKLATPKERPVLETLVFAICLEDASLDTAEKVYQKLLADWSDLNEARVSAVSELEQWFAGQRDPDLRAYRFRNVLQYIFEKSFGFEFESLKKKTLELAAKQLQKIRHLSPFVRNYALQQVIGAHLLPFDMASVRALGWLGLVGPGQMTEDAANEALKGSIRKAEAEQFCAAIRAFATDVAVRDVFDDRTGAVPWPEQGFDVGTSLERLERLLSLGGAKYAAALQKEFASEEKARKAEEAATQKKTAAAQKKAAKTSAAPKTAPAKAAKASAKSAKTKSSTTKKR